MKKILLMLVIVKFACGNSLDRELNGLTESQRNILLKTHNLGRMYNLQWTMTAIAWQESSFGSYKVGKSTPDYGVFQINLKSFKARYKTELEEINTTDAQIAKMLTKDYDLNFTAALAEIKFWQHIHSGNFLAVWGSYNGGYKGNRKYANTIRSKIKALKRYMKRNKIDIMDTAIKTNK